MSKSPTSFCHIVPNLRYRLLAIEIAIECLAPVPMVHVAPADSALDTASLVAFSMLGDWL